MNRADFDEMVRAKATDYERMQIEAALARVEPADQLVLPMLAGVLFYKGAAATLQVLDLAGKVAAASSIGSDHVRASVEHAFSAEAWQILSGAMK